MLDLKEIENILWSGTVSDVDKECTKLKIGKTGIKEDKINKILDFYKKDNWVEDTYNSLNEYELELTIGLVQQKFNPTRKSINIITNKYRNSNLSVDKFYSFFIYETVPNTIKKELEKLVPPLEISFESIKDIDIEKEYGYIIDFENRIDIFDEYIKYCNTHKVKLTNKNRYLSKSDLLKYHELVKYNDIIRNNNKFEDIKSIKDTIVSFGIMKLLEASYIMNYNNEYIKTNIYYDDFIKMNKYGKAKFLLKSYINSSTVFLNETDRVLSSKVRLQPYPELKMPREFIINMIKLLPEDLSWVKADEFREKIRMKDYNFLREYTGYVLTYHDDGFYKYEDEANFNDFEAGFIDIVLMEYLAIIGVVDVILEESYNDSFDKYIQVKYLRMTNLGLMLLGLKEEKLEVIDNKFILNDDSEVIIPKSDNSLEYELFFERFCECFIKDNSKVYKLDFNSIIKALDLNISISDIIDFIKEKSSSY